LIGGSCVRVLQLSLLSSFHHFLYDAPRPRLSKIMVKNSTLIPVERIEKAIYMIRGEKVILDEDLATLYGTDTRSLVQAVKRNIRRFPVDFMFQLSSDEFKSLRSQIVISKIRGGRRSPPFAFTEHGVIMAANVLNSPQAARASVEVVRTFVRLRQMLATNAELSRRLDELESKYDRQFKVVFDAIRQLMSPKAPTRKTIGFR
jgi:hypothetical protein